MKSIGILAIALALVACHEEAANDPDVSVPGPDISTAEVATDATGDDGPEVDVDVAAELPPEVTGEVIEDVPVELPEEVQAEVADDVAQEVADDVAQEVADDVAQEVASEVIEDVPPADDGGVEIDVPLAGPGIADLRAAANDTVLDPPIVVEGAVVTYVKPVDGAGGNGYFVQQVSDGPGIFVFTDAVDPSTLVDVGDVITLSVSEVTEFQGNKQVKTATATVQSSDGDVEALTQDLSVGTPLTEGLEAERVRLTGGTLIHGIGDVWTIEYAGQQQTGTVVYFGGFQAAGACAGLQVSVSGVVTEFNGAHQLQLWRPEDITNSDGTSCAPADTSNWDFESGPSYEPPSGFNVALNDDIGMVDETSDVNTGAHSVGVIWYTSDNWEMRAAWLPPVPSGEPEMKLHAWYLDEDPCAKSRLGFKRWDAAGEQVGSTSYSSYTSDSPRWQEVVATVAPEAGDAYVSLFARFYDEVAEDACYSDPANKETSFDGGVLFFDDWALTTTVSFDATDGTLDTLEGSPSTPPLLFGGVSAALNDAGELYVSGPKAAANDHVVYVWVGEPSLSTLVPAPLGKGGQVAAADNGVLLALSQDGAGVCSWLVYETGNDWVTVDGAGCSGGGAVMEGAVTLPSLAALGLSDAAGLPVNLWMTLAPYAAGPGGSLDELNMQPAASSVDGDIAGDESAAVHRHVILVGRYVTPQ